MSQYYQTPVPDSHWKYFFPNITLDVLGTQYFKSEFFRDVVTLQFSSVIEEEEEITVVARELTDESYDGTMNSIIEFVDPWDAELTLLINQDKEFPEDYDMPDGYGKDEKVSLFLNQRTGANVITLVSEEKRKAVVIFDNKDHFMACSDTEKGLLIGLPVLIKWRFDAEYRKTHCHPLIDYIKDGDMEEIARLVKDEYDKLDLRETLIKDILEDFEDRFQKKTIDAARRQQESCRIELADLKDRYCRAAEEYNRLSFSVFAMENHINSKEPGDFMKFCLSCECITPISLDDNSFKFQILTTIESYDPDMMRAAINNEDSKLYESLCYEEHEDFRKIYSALFSDDPLIRLKTGAEITLSFSNGNIKATKRDLPFAGDYIPNRHLGEYNCWGQNLSLALEYYSKADYIGMMSQIIAMVQNVNAGETSTWAPMIIENFDTDGKFIILPDGTEASFKETLEWLNAQEEQEA